MITEILIDIVIFILAAIPLYLAVKFLNGKATLLKAVLVNFIAGIIFAAIRARFSIFGGIIAFILLIWIYREVFRLKWHKAFLAWLLQFIIIFLFYFILFFIAVLFGLTLIAGVIPI